MDMGYSDPVEDDEAEICGESYDHDLRFIDERDGIRTYECRGCGAEIIEEDEDGID